MYARTIILETINSYSASIKVEELAEHVWDELEKFGFHAAIINDKGVDLIHNISGYDYKQTTVWFRRDRKHDTWKAFQVINGKNRYL